MEYMKFTEKEVILYTINHREPLDSALAHEDIAVQQILHQQLGKGRDKNAEQCHGFVEAEICRVQRLVDALFVYRQCVFMPLRSRRATTKTASSSSSSPSLSSSSLKVETLHLFCPRNRSCNPQLPVNIEAQKENPLASASLLIRLAAVAINQLVS